jgi:glutaminyl-peptide cyclotransferase
MYCIGKISVMSGQSTPTFCFPKRGNEERRQMKKFLLFTPVITLCTILISHCGGQPKSAPVAAVPTIVPSIVRTLPHDSLAFTQGLLYADGRLYESTGQYAQSSLRRLDPASGSADKIVPLKDVFFGEGLALSGDRLVQLTWRESRALIYSQEDLRLLAVYIYEGEGWGLTTRESEFIMSNGSDTMYFRDQNFDVTRAVAVTLQGKPLTKLNELEFVKGLVYANVWFSNFIFEIDPSSGAVKRIIDCTALIGQAGATGQDKVLNGIAYRPETATFFLTGKNWPKMFEVKMP